LTLHTPDKIFLHLYNVLILYKTLKFRPAVQVRSREIIDFVSGGGFPSLLDHAGGAERMLSSQQVIKKATVSGGLFITPLPFSGRSGAGWV
jgi:hypothetical protein